MFKKKYIFILIAVILIIAGSLFGYYALNPNYTISGTIIDSENGQGIPAVTVQAGDQEVTSNDVGLYEMNGVKNGTVVKYILPPIYKPVDEPLDYENGTKTGFHTLQISKDVEATPTEEEKASRVKKDVEVIVRDLMFGRYAEEYDAMEPDSKTMISKEDYIKSAQTVFKSASLTDYKIGDVKFLDKWNAMPAVNKDYNNVAEVEVTFVVQILGISQNINKVTHYVKVDGKWCWFYAPGSGS